MKVGLFIAAYGCAALDGKTVTTYGGGTPHTIKINHEFDSLFDSCCKGAKNLNQCAPFVMHPTTENGHKCEVWSYDEVLN